MKVYELPDKTTSEWWVMEDSYAPLRITFHPGFYTPGRWLPVELPKFPEREKAPARLCMATVDGERQMLVWFNRSCEMQFRSTKEEYRWRWNHEVTDIEWLTPEYCEDMPGKKEPPPCST